MDNLHAEEDTSPCVCAGGTVVLGTDSPLAGLAILNHLGLRAEVKFGMQPWEALQTVTLLPARAFGYAKDLGSVEAGKLADLILVEGDPVRDIKDVAKVQKVMVDGRLYSIRGIDGAVRGQIDRRIPCCRRLILVLGAASPAFGQAQQIRSNN